jgi:hypothetical protein
MERGLRAVKCGHHLSPEVDYREVVYVHSEAIETSLQDGLVNSNTLIVHLKLIGLEGIGPF